MDAPQVIPNEILITIFSVMGSDALSNMYRDSPKYRKLLQNPHVLKTIAESNGIPYVVEHTSKGQLIVDRRIKDFYDLIFAMRLREDPEKICLGIVRKLHIAIRDRDPTLLKRLLVDYSKQHINSRTHELLGEYGDIRLINMYIDFLPDQSYYYLIFYYLATYHHNDLVHELFEKFGGESMKKWIFDGACNGLNYQLISEMLNDEKYTVKIGGPLYELVKAAARSGDEKEVTKALKFNTDAGYAFKDVISFLIGGYLSGGHLENVKELFKKYPDYFSTEEINADFYSVLESNCRKCFDWLLEKAGGIENEEANVNVKYIIIDYVKYSEHVPSFLWDVIDRWHDIKFNQELFEILLKTDDLEDIIKMYGDYGVFLPSSLRNINKCFSQWLELRQPPK